MGDLRFDARTALLDLLDKDGVPLPGAPMGILLSAQAAFRPDAPAFTFCGQTLTFAGMDQAANRMARAFAKRGLCAGDRVVVSMGNSPAYAQALFAIWKLGATPCPISHRLTPGEFAEIVALAQPRLIVGSDGTPSCDGLRFDITKPLPHDIDDRPLPPAISSPGKIMASGGSTGRPKLIVDPMDSSWGTDKQAPFRPPGSVILNAGPMYHAAPFAYSVVGLAEGSHVVCMERFDPEQWLHLVEQYSVTAATLVPTMMSRIARLNPIISMGAALESLRYLMHSSAPCPPDIKRWWLGRVEPGVIWEVYGGTERLGATFITGDEWLAHPGSVGRPPEGDTVVIVDNDGRPLPHGEIGEILFRRANGPGTTYRYIGAESRIEGDLDGMGDMGWLDAEGYLYIADRRTDMILIGGVNVYPAEIEAVLEQVPGIACAAVIGLPDADIGNVIHAIIELAPGTAMPDDAEGLSFLAPAMPMLAPFKRPRSVEFTRERIRDDTGKTRRSALRAARMNGQQD